MKIAVWGYKELKVKTKSGSSKPTYMPTTIYLTKSHLSTIGSSDRRGRRCMMSCSGLLKPRAVAGRPSVTKLTQSSWTGHSVSGRPNAAAIKMQTTSPKMIGKKVMKARRQKHEDYSKVETHQYCLRPCISQIVSCC